MGGALCKDHHPRFGKKGDALRGIPQPTENNKRKVKGY